MNDRDCENCAHHTGGSCSVWECSFERKENDMIYRQDTIDAMEGVDWYHINKGGQLTHGANSKEDEPLYKAKDVYKVLNHMPSAQSTQTDTSNSLKALDCVERQAAIDAVKKNTFRLTFAEEQNCEGHVAWSAYAVYSDVMEGALLELSSAQPEIIRCKYCRYSEYDALYDDRYCHYDGKADIVPDEHYCGYAERKTDE